MHFRTFNDTEEPDMRRKQNENTPRQLAPTAPYNEQIKPILEALARGDTIQYATTNKGWMDFSWDQIMEHLRVRLDPEQLRVKPNVLIITIGDVTNEVPAPWRGAIELGQEYWVPSVLNPEHPDGQFTWNHGLFDLRIRDTGLLHTDRGNAVLHARALRGEKL